VVLTSTAPLQAPIKVSLTWNLSHKIMGYSRVHILGLAFAWNTALKKVLTERCMAFCFSSHPDFSDICTVAGACLSWILQICSSSSCPSDGGVFREIPQHTLHARIPILFIASGPNGSLMHTTLPSPHVLDHLKRRLARHKIGGARPPETSAIVHIIRSHWQSLLCYRYLFDLCIIRTSTNYF
jgi:hypothetical protein